MGLWIGMSPSRLLGEQLCLLTLVGNGESQFMGLTCSQFADKREKDQEPGLLKDMLRDRDWHSSHWDSDEHVSLQDLSWFQLC